MRGRELPCCATGLANQPASPTNRARQPTGLANQPSLANQPGLANQPASPLAWSLPLQRHAHDLFVVSHEHALVSVCRVAPDNVAAGVWLCRFDDFGSADLLVTLGRKIGEDQVALVGEDEKLFLCGVMNAEPNCFFLPP